MDDYEDLLDNLGDCGCDTCAEAGDAIKALQKQVTKLMAQVGADSAVIVLGSQLAHDQQKRIAELERQQRDGLRVSQDTVDLTETLMKHRRP